MSAASEPVARTGLPSAARHTLFLPVLIVLFGLGLQVCYQITHLEDQLDTATRTADDLDLMVKHTEYDRNKLFALSRDLIDASATDPSAAQLVNEFHLTKLQKPTDSSLTVTPILPAGGSTNASSFTSPK